MSLSAILRRLVAALTLLPLAAAAQEGTRPLPAHGLGLPATFIGTLPMASGPGREMHLDLWPDQIFHLRERRDGAVEDSLGRWSAAPEGDRLTLHRADRAEHFAVAGEDRLRLLDPSGAPIESDLPLDLVAAGGLDPTALALPLWGEVRYMADAALFRECRTGRAYPVVFAEDWIALERAYAAQGAAGAPVMAALDGRLEMRPAMEGPDRTSLVVTRFATLLPGLTCETARAAADLANTYWRLVSLADAEAVPQAGRREPHLALLPGAEPRFRATVGCNAIVGGWRGGLGALSFGPAAATRMACPPPLDAAERGLIAALEATEAARITGPLLELLDSAGTVLARFQAVYLY